MYQYNQLQAGYILPPGLTPITEADSQWAHYGRGMLLQPAPQSLQQQQFPQWQGIRGGGPQNAEEDLQTALCMMQNQYPQRAGVEMQRTQQFGGELGYGAGLWGHITEPRANMYGNGVQPIVDMKSLQFALDSVEAGTGQIRQILNSSTFRPRLPGLTKIMSRFTRDNKWQKAQEVFEALQDLHIRPDTTIANAAISACDKGGQWEKALQIFKNMETWRLDRDAITYSAVISALAKGRQWTVAIEVFHHMCSSGIEADAVTCCSLITALDKGGQWQLAEQVFIHMYAADPRYHLLLHLDDDHSAMLATQELVKQLTDRTSDLSQLVDSQSNLIAQRSLNSTEPQMSLDTNEISSRNSASSALISALQIDAANKGLLSIAENEQGCQKVPSQVEVVTPDVTAGRSLAAVAVEVFGSGSNNAAGGELSAASQLQSQLSGTRQPGFVSSKDSFDFSNLQSALSQETTSSHPFQQYSQLFGQHSLPAGMDIQVLLNQKKLPGIQRTNTLDSVSSFGQTYMSPMSRLQRIASDEVNYEMLRNRSGVIRTSSISSKKTAPNRVCCNALLAAYARAKPPQWRRALKLLELMWECAGEVVPDIVSYNTVMKACSNAAQLDTALQVYYLMKQRGLEPSVATYGTLISAASEVEAYDTVMMVWEALNASGLECNTTCMNALIHALEQQDRWDEAWIHFQRMLDSNSKVHATTMTFNTMMSACIRRGEIQRTKELFNTMFKMQIQPTIQSYNTLLQAYALTGQWKDSMEWLKHISKPDVNVRPNITSYNYALASIYKATLEASVQEKEVMAVGAIQVAEQAKSMSGSEPDLSMFNSLISIMNETGKYTQSLQAYNQMVQKGIKPDSITASYILYACTKGDKLWEAAIALFNRFKVMGIEPDSVVYNVSVSACARSGAWQQALEIFTEMMSGDFSIDKISLQTVMKGLRDAGQWELLSKLFEILRENKSALTTNVYNMVLSAYEISGEFDKGTEVLRELLEAGLAPDHATLNQLLRLLTKSSNNLQKALEAYGWMLEGCGYYQLYPNEETYLILIEGLANHKQVKDATEIAIEGHKSDVLSFYKHPKDNLNEISSIDVDNVPSKVALILLNAWIDTILIFKSDHNKKLGVDKLSISCSSEALRDTVRGALEGEASEILGVDQSVEKWHLRGKVGYQVEGMNSFVFSIECNDFYKFIQY